MPVICVLVLILPAVAIITDDCSSGSLPEYTEVDGVRYTVTNNMYAIATIVTLNNEEIRILEKVTVNGTIYPVLSISDNYSINYRTKTLIVESDIVDLSYFLMDNFRALENITIPADSSKNKIIDGVLYDVTGHKLIFIPYSKRTGTVTIGPDVTFFPSVCNFSTTESFAVAEGNTSFKAVDGILYSFDMTKLVAYPGSKTDRTYVMPDTVSSIGLGAMNDCIYLDDVTLSENLNSMASSAFDGTYLKRIHIGSSLNTGLLNLSINKEIEAVLYLPDHAGTTVSLGEVDFSELSDEVKKKVRYSKVYRVLAENPAQIVVHFESDYILRPNTTLYEITADSELKKLAHKTEDDKWDSVAINSGSLFVVIDDTVLTTDQALIISAVILILAIILAVIVLVMRKKRPKIPLPPDNEMAGLLRFRDKKSILADYRISLLVVVILALLPIIEGSMLYYNSINYDLFPSSYRIDSDMWTSFNIVFECFFACILIYYSYTRMAGHSSSDIQWRMSIIHSLESSGQDVHELRLIDERMRRTETFKFRPYKILVYCCFLFTALYTVLYYDFLMTAKISLPIFGSLPALTYLPIVFAATLLVLVYPTLVTFVQRHEMDQQEFLTVLSLYSGYEHIPMMDVGSRRFSWPFHIILIILTCGFYAVFNIFRSIYQMNRHLVKQGVCSDWLRSYGEGVQYRDSYRLPLVLITVELFLIVICLTYIFDIFGYGGDILNMFIDGKDVGLTDFKFVRTSIMILIDVIFLENAFEAVLFIPRRTQESRIRILDTCFKFIISSVASAFLISSDSLTQVFSFNVYISVAVTVALIIWVVLSRRIYSYYRCDDESESIGLFGYYKKKIPSVILNIFTKKTSENDEEQIKEEEDS